MRTVVVVDLIKGGGPAWPRIESDEFLMSTGSARPLEDAYRVSQHDLVTWAAELTGWETLDAYQLVSQAGPGAGGQRRGHQLHDGGQAGEAVPRHGRRRRRRRARPAAGDGRGLPRPALSTGRVVVCRPGSTRRQLDRFHDRLRARRTASWTVMSSPSWTCAGRGRASATTISHWSSSDSATSVGGEEPLGHVRPVGTRRDVAEVVADDEQRAAAAPPRPPAGRTAAAAAPAAGA